MIAIDEYVNFLIKHKINPKQLLLLYLLYERKHDLIKNFKLAFPIKDGTMIPLEDITDLVNKKFLIKVGSKYKLGDLFLSIFVNPERAVDEVYNLYPPFTVSDKGVNIPLCSMDRNVFKKIYIIKIQGSVVEHQKVLEDIKYGVKNDLLRIGINKFLTSEHWKSIRKHRLTRTTTKNIQIDKNF